MEGYIDYLTDENIEVLFLPILYKRMEKSFSDNWLNDMNLKELIKLKQKILIFKFKNETLKYMSNVIYEPNKKVYVESEYKQLLKDLKQEYGDYDDFLYQDVELEGENKLTKEQQISKFKSILKYNINFIMNNKMRILERIEEVYVLKNKEKNEDLKAKMKEYNSRDDVKQKKKDYNNREDIKAKQKAYCNEKVDCECGFNTARKHLTRHKKTELHTKRLNSLSNNVVI